MIDGGEGGILLMVSTACYALQSLAKIDGRKFSGLFDLSVIFD